LRLPENIRAFLGLLVGLGCALLSCAAFGQGTIQQSGPVTQFHLPTWWQNGLQGDAGSPSTPFIDSLGIFSGSSCPFGISSQTGPGLSSSPYAEISICQTNTTTTFMIEGLNGQAAPALYFNIGGVQYAFPGPGNGTVIGPVSSTNGDLSCFNGTTGQLLEDCGLHGTFANQNYATPPAIGGVTPNAGSFSTLSATGTVSGAGITSLFASPPAIGGTAPAAANFTTGAFTGQITSTLSTGTPPFVVASTTNVANLNASSLNGATFGSPGAIGGTAPGSAAFTSLSASSTVSGSGFSTYLASPPSIGGTAAANGSFTTLDLNTALQINGVVAESGTAPVIASGFGTSAAIVASNGTAAFTLNVGTSNTGTGVLTMAAASHGWACHVNDITTKGANVATTQVTATSTTSVTVQNYSDAMATHDWTDSDVLQFQCTGY
jgi:hypothetical protein